MASVVEVAVTPKLSVITGVNCERGGVCSCEDPLGVCYQIPCCRRSMFFGLNRNISGSSYNRIHEALCNGFGPSVIKSQPCGDPGLG